MAPFTSEASALTTRYRAYCNACQSNQLSTLTDFWSLPALFTIDYGGPSTVCKVVTSAGELEELYSGQFGASTGVDRTEIEAEDVKFLGERLAVLETRLRHWVGERLHDRQRAVYTCRKVEGVWMFVAHASVVESA